MQTDNLTVELEEDRSKKTDLSRIIINGEAYFKIGNIDELRPFLMSVVSHTDLWMFLSSNGGVTAGRKNSNHALFPYYTDDKITRSSEATGSKTIIRLLKDGQTHYWEPYSDRFNSKYRINRNLYKNVIGTKVRFEEINHDLNLTFWYEWSSSEAFGFVRTSCLNNYNPEDLTIEIVDGIQNILPSGVGADLQNRFSNLVDAYRRSELISDSSVAVYALSANIVDKAEPSEALKANTVWSFGLNRDKVLLTNFQLAKFRKGSVLSTESDIKGERGAYLISSKMVLGGQTSKEWSIVADVNKDQSAVVELVETIRQNPNLNQQVLGDIKSGRQKLIRLNASSDGLQMTQDLYRDARHFSNTLFNIMRGGVFDDNYQIDKNDFLVYLSKANKAVFSSHSHLFDELGEIFSVFELNALAEKTNDTILVRLCIEYLPLKFSRRHGDPSRPWNMFSINTRHEETGKKILDYEGNWRDIFQNWEALSHSFPEFIMGMIFKFLNATTFDGYNPYRVTKDGFDWETIEPDDPWSYIGYWGDHQIVYLLKFLEFSQKHDPQRLIQFLDKDIFVYANVPYRIRSYQQILRNPKDTIDFDHDLDLKIRSARVQHGADGALLTNEAGEIYQVNLIEKILASVLAKLSNFIPEAGIWMNTQRPEWNDANNALVGNGVSVVTLGYLRRMFAFLQEFLSQADIESVRVSNEIVDFYKRIRSSFEKHQSLLAGKISDHQRKAILDELGEAASDFRQHVYEHGLWGRKRTISLAGLNTFIANVLSFLEHSLTANERQDGMYHSYNLMSVTIDNAIRISPLSEMLEGQVSILSSGSLTSEEALGVLDGLKSSALFRDDQYSYLLYPNKELPRFLEKNILSEKQVQSSLLLQTLVASGNEQIIKKDVLDGYHFNGKLHNANDLEKALKALPSTEYSVLVDKEWPLLMELYEGVFNHTSFTGRSGTFFGYEGLGSIYWHMVSKLQLAVQECAIKACENKEDASIIGRLLEHYYEINEGIGVHKPPSLYGAFPTDAYSHTPLGRGAQQPGMTGQVKEDILSRFGELGVFVKNGHLLFFPCLLRKDEFLITNGTFKYVDVNQNQKQINVSAGMLCFTYCQVPVVYKLSDKNSITLVKKDAQELKFNTLSLDENYSAAIFNRTGEVDQIIVELDHTNLR